MPINSLKPLFDKVGVKSEISYTNVATGLSEHPGRLVQVKPTTNVDDEVSISNRLSLRDSEPASPINATEVSECQSFGAGTTLAAAKTKAKAACLSNI